MLRWIAVALCSVGLIACGGGGGRGSGGSGNDDPGGNPPPPQPQPQPQSISFAEPGPVYKFAGDVSYANVATGGSGTGAVTYSSDTPAVVTVEASTGAVTIVGLGSAQITASKAADANYTAAQASYTLRIAPRTVDMTAWIGPADAEITFAPEAAALEFTRSSDPRCDPNLYTLCAHGIQSAITTANVVDSTANFSGPAIYWMKHGTHTTHGVMAPDARTEPGYAYPNLVTFNGKLWLWNRFGSSYQVWSSVDGLNWRLENGAAPGIEGSRLLVFNNALWVVGTRDRSWIAEVWRSADGQTWSEVPQSLPRAGRTHAGATVHNGRIWLAGGNDGTGTLNDVWSSEDGSTWTQATAAAAFSPRMHLELTSFAGRLWVIGGWGPGTAADIWSSADGATWTQETASPAFGSRFEHKIVTSAETMWLIGGRDGYQSARRDVWSSTDGRAWTLVTADAEFPPLGQHAAALWNDTLWVHVPATTAMWSSPDGAQWTKQTVSAAIPGAAAAESAAAFEGRIWMIDVEFRIWSSADGFSWRQELHEAPTATTSLGATGMLLLASADRLFLVGGLTWVAPNYERELWASSDGRNWSRLTDTLPVRGDGHVQLLQFNGQLWAFGSPHTDAAAAEVWSSPDGIGWTRVAATPEFAPRYAHQVLAYDGRMWAIGGATPPSNPQDDVWFSTDGATWTRVDTPTGLPAGTFQSSLAFDTGMCVYGLFQATLMHTAWCSSDGRTWQKRADDVPIGGPRTVLDGTIFAIGRTEARFWSSDQVWKSTDGFTWRLGYRNSLRFP